LRAPPRRLLIAAQLIAAALLLYFVGREIARQWAAFRTEPLTIDVDGAALVFSALIVIATYALLIQVWRMLIAGSGASLRFWSAVRIFTISGLWRWVPGKVWSIGAMGAMSHREGVPPVAAAGAAILGTVLNIATGLAITLLLAWRWLGAWNADAQPAAVVLLVAGVVGVLALPYTLPKLGALAARVTGKSVELRAPPPWALGVAVLGNLISWVLYGLAFQWLVRAVLGDALGDASQYIVVFAASYVIGYLFLIAPGGVGPREGVMIMLLTSFHLATAKEAALIAVTSRVWLTILETVPGLLFLAHEAARGRRNELPPDVPKTG
jgi:glycosyltransferase 2 family protein